MDNLDSAFENACPRVTKQHIRIVYVHCVTIHTQALRWHHWTCLRSMDLEACVSMQTSRIGKEKTRIHVRRFESSKDCSGRPLQVESINHGDLQRQINPSTSQLVDSGIATRYRHSWCLLSASPHLLISPPTPTRDSWRRAPAGHVQGPAAWFKKSQWPRGTRWGPLVSSVGLLLGWLPS